jgi:anti-anti-sigma factor
LQGGILSHRRLGSFDTGRGIEFINGTLLAIKARMWWPWNRTARKAPEILQRSGSQIEFKLLDRAVYHVRLVGDFGLSSVRGLDYTLRRIEEEGVIRVVVNLETADYLCSAAIACLLAYLQNARGKGGEFVFVGASARVNKVFELLGLHRILGFRANMREALAAFKETSLSA